MGHTRGEVRCSGREGGGGGREEEEGGGGRRGRRGREGEEGEEGEGEGEEAGWAVVYHTTKFKPEGQFTCNTCKHIQPCTTQKAL